MGWWAGGLVGWWAGGLVGWSAGRLVGWSAGGLVGWSAGRLVGWRAGGGGTSSRPDAAVPLSVFIKRIVSTWALTRVTGW